MPASEASATIYVARRGWHIDIGFDTADLKPPLDSLAARFPGARYLFFGFGDEHYLLAKDHNAPVLLGALWPGRGMLLLTGLTSTPREAFGAEHVLALTVTEQQARDAQSFIWQSLEKPSRATSDRLAGDDPAARDSHSTDADSLPSFAPGPYEGSLYFSAVPEYSAFHTCNTWAAETLATAALPIHSAGVIFAGQLWSQVRRLEHKKSADSAPAEPPRSTRLNTPAEHALLSRADSTRSGTQPSSPSSAALPRWCSSPAAADCCC